MNHSRIIRRHYWARALILLGFALLIAHLTQSGALHYYIGPRMEPLLRFCPIPLVVMAVCLAYQALFQRSAALCDCERPLSVSRWKNVTVYGLFLLPLLLGTLLPDQALGSSAAAKKGMSLNSPCSPPNGWRNFFEHRTLITANLLSWPNGSMLRPSSKSSRRSSPRRLERWNCSPVNSAAKKSS